MSSGAGRVILSVVILSGVKRFASRNVLTESKDPYSHIEVEERRAVPQNSRDREFVQLIGILRLRSSIRKRMDELAQDDSSA
jgi:hypothetical protein